MTFPASVDTVTLTVGPLYDAGGLPRRGVPLTARLPRLVKITEGGAALPTVTTDRTDETGTASLTLVATDSQRQDVGEPDARERVAAGHPRGGARSWPRVPPRGSSPPGRTTPTR